MNRRRIAAMLGIFMGISLLAAGCAKTPESGLVKQKGKSAEKHYQEGAPLTGEGVVDEEAQSEGANGADTMTEGSADPKDASEGSVEAAQTEAVKTTFTEQTGTDYRGILRERLGAPEHYQSEVTDVTGKLKVLTDAQVEIPNASKVSAITVKQHPLDQEQIDLITETFFKDAVIYDAGGYHIMTQADWQARLEELNGYQAAGNLDPYCMGMDQKGNYVFDLEQEIQKAKEQIQTAPAERVLKEVRPAFGLKTVTLDGQTEVKEDSFSGIAKMDGHDYEYKIEKAERSPFLVYISRIPDGTARDQSYFWTPYQQLKQYTQGLPEENELPDEIGISLEEAKEIGDAKVKALGFTDMTADSWEYSVLRVLKTTTESETSTEGEIRSDIAYLLHYTRRPGGMPITYTDAWGGVSESMEEEAQSWNYERVDLYITKDGVVRADLCSRYDIGAVKTENLELLPFEDVMEIYEKMMLVVNARMASSGSCNYKIDRMSLGYTRIYEPLVDAYTGTLVPVWDFFGSYEVADELDGEEWGYTYSKPYESFLTVNAVDGSIIDRNLGY